MFISVFLLSSCDYLTPLIAEYSYSHEITEREQNSFVLTNEKTLIYLRDKGVYEDQELKFYVGNFNESFFNEFTNEVGISRKNYGYRSVMSILDRIYHKEGNYGLIFGMANYVARDLGNIYQGYAHNSNEIFSYVSYRPEIMDLTYPLFDEDYADTNTRAYAMEFSTLFTTYLIEQYSVEFLDQLIKIEDDALFAENYYKYLNEYLEVIGLQAYNPEYYIVFSRDKTEYAISWKTKHSNWYLEDDFYDTFFYVSHPDLFRDGYFNLVNLIRSLETEMDRVALKLGRNDITYPKISIYLVDSRNSGYYRTNLSFLSTIFSLSHEYVHHLQSNYIYSSTWLKESMAIYYSMEFEYTQVYFDRIYQLDGLQDKIAYAITEYKNIYGDNARYRDDIYEFADIYVLSNNDFNDVYEAYGTESFFPYVSFTNYFMEEFSEEIYFEVVQDETLILEKTGFTWQEIVDNWEIYIKNKY